MYTKFGGVCSKGKDLHFFHPTPPLGGFGGEFFKQKLSEITSPTTLLMRQLAVELIV